MSTDDKAPSETQLYVSNLPFSYTDENLREIFKDFKVRKAYVATRRNGRSKGFGFVDLESAAEQARALEAINDLELEGRKLFVSVAHKDDRRDESGVIKEEYRSELPPKKGRGGGAGGRAPREPQEPSETIVYVANIPFEFEEKDLNELFKAHNVKSSRVARRRNDRSKGFAFVELATHADQQAALALDGHKLKAGTEEERIISVKVSVVQTTEAPAPRASGGGGGGRGAREEPARDPEDDLPSEIAVYVSNIPFDLSDEQLADVFASRGVKPARAHVARRRGNDRSKGFGFVVFNNNADQKKALQVAEGVTLGERELNVKIARKGSEKAPEDRPRRRTGAKRGAAAGAGRAPAGERREKREPREKRPSQTLVYVSNLAFDIDDEQLRLIFDGLDVTSAHVARRHNGRSKGFGFVELANNAEQTKALAKNGTSVQDREISVEVANEVVEKSE